MVFDLSKPVAKAISAPMGGGWIVPLNDLGRAVLRRFFDEEPTPLIALDGEPGWIVEPQQAGDLAEYLREAGHAWNVE